MEVDTRVSEVKILFNCEILNESLNLPRLTWQPYISEISDQVSHVHSQVPV